ncbi:hypothetical protein [Pseudoroseicyclus sp. CXY001]|uniref:hypothetical protein n=1 Tax=Pseudoroseicyclus sp. CXY001 TaxID=3242492 RepID=UPI00357151F6
MKRDKNLQIEILKKLEASEDQSLRFEVYAKNFGGYDDAETPDWSREEAYNARLLIRDGFVRTEKVTDAPWFGPGPEDTYAETYAFLTSAGHDRIENANWLKAAWSNIWSNIPTFLASVITALIIAWAVKIFGPQL